MPLVSTQPSALQRETQLADRLSQSIVSQALRSRIRLSGEKPKDLEQRVHDAVKEEARELKQAVKHKKVNWSNVAPLVDKNIKHEMNAIADQLAEDGKDSVSLVERLIEQNYSALNVLVENIAQEPKASTNKNLETLLSERKTLIRELSFTLAAFHTQLTSVRIGSYDGLETNDDKHSSAPYLNNPVNMHHVYKQLDLTQTMKSLKDDVVTTLMDN